MRVKKTLTISALAMTAALTLAACSGGTDDAAAPDAGDDALFEVATDVTLEGSPTYDAMVAADTVRIGVKEDQPNFGFLDASTGERTGFDIDIAEWIAASLGFSEDQIEFQAIPSSNRESAIVNGDIDYYVGTYSITDARKDQVDFAGPYFVSGQGLLVAADNDSVESKDDLSADTTVCSVTGSTPLKNLKAEYPDIPTVEFETYSQCIEALNDGQVDVITTDQAILAGYVQQSPDTLKIVGDSFSTENYGIGLPKGDDALRGFINDTLTDGDDTWNAIFDANLSESGLTADKPDVDAY
jgi:glutamate transport system substrate-binding protein